MRFVFTGNYVGINERKKGRERMEKRVARKRREESKKNKLFQIQKKRKMKKAV